jgi:hypothetical protein
LELDSILLGAICQPAHLSVFRSENVALIGLV